MKRRSKTKRLYTLLGAMAIAMGLYAYNHVSDDYIRDRVVLLTGNGIACSGAQVRAPSGKDYILTAGHCRDTVTEGAATTTTDNGKTRERSFVAEDPTSDLMLLEGLPGLSGLAIGDSAPRLTRVRAFTRGGLQPTYETSGVIVGTEIAQAPVDLDEEHCVGSKYQTQDVNPFIALLLGLSTGRLCLLAVEETVSTTPIAQGSSGGPLLDASGDLVGIASMTSPTFSTWVKLSDIRAFLAGY